MESLPLKDNVTMRMNIFRHFYGSHGDEKKSLVSSVQKQISANEEPVNPLSYSSDTTLNSASQVELRWQNISVFLKQTTGRRWYKTKTEKPACKQILSNVSGVALPGQLLAIMGSSGCGKTTLLNVLSMRNQSHLTVHGNVLVNGRRLSRPALASISSYVRQEELFFGMLTVREQLTFQALLRLDDNVSYSQRIKRVEEVMQELGLTDCQNTLIGIPGRLQGISGGERRRMAVAAEVLTDPSLLFCDEPTSGLDSFMAQNVVSLLRNIAAKGKTVICAIHQPSSYQYALFDRIMLMASGNVAFLGTPDEAMSFFSRLQYACPTNCNPAEHFIHVLSSGNAENGDQENKLATMKICEAFALSETATKFSDESKMLCVPNGDFQAMDSFGSDESGYKVSIWKQFRAVMWRSHLCVIRNPLLVKARFIQMMGSALILGIIYYGQKLDQDGITNINGLFYLTLATAAYQNMVAVVNVFCADIPIFLTERWNRMYRTDVYFICRTTAECPVFIVVPTFSTLIIYWMVGLNPEINKAFIACLVMILVTNAGVSFGYFVSAVIHNINVALALGVTLITPMIIIGGFVFSTRTIPWYLIWLQYISWFTYSNEALGVNQWTGISNIKCYNNITCQYNGLIVLQTLNFHPENLWRNIVILVLIIIGYRILALIALHIRTWRAQT